MYLLCDINSMYASCEQLFRPDLKNRPVVVLSNNDGACVALNRAAKALGIKRGVPFFQVKDLVHRHGVVVFSSNYALYGDMSARVCTVLESLAPELTVYSIDEAFLTVTGIDASESFVSFGHRVKDMVLQHTGLACGIGIAQTRTLAKLANHAAKTWPATKGVVVLTERHRQRKLLNLLPVSEVWGIGRKLSTRLHSMGIKTALQLADAHLPFIRKNFGVTVERTVRELNGISCISVDELPAKEQIICSRSFGERITTLQAMHEAVCQYAERAAEKLRGERRYCRHITVFVRTSPFSNEPYYSNSASQKMMIATQDTRDIIAAAVRALDQIWRDGFRYQKAGIMLNDFSDKAGQIDLFDDTPPRANSVALMEVLDDLNHTGSRIWFAGQGISKDWKMKREMLSPAYTTNWKEIPRVMIR
ncbi:translesion error-prone DNA polymerase V subunit UmuC [Salmonella enterica subsp. enterica serovar Benue]|uniref:translesion error-prone DNA polymerase V subunit UmuC n=1 Tax=Salmonella enterica TaxID=28901 RepID=UPI0018D1DA75|nr:translesion error-prone DNA polymerase V subunit UmuC [Salmonella enterica]EDR3562071.1 translesion error-prone DNA polymerase V subunit UmuC [Salmonella enterica subsp. enterica serovar Benue]MBH0601290.1 translesion error-prone DNA polymerase V subunit UmuC [Salmonella enterica]MBH0654986.1 translesion error-prone DNA polymerase V subunit UmuC [Salmonella enterica]MBH0667776.1 translesion error-prone DNA polymerase V subunit UmuC [Salmonella enterica]MCU7163117.1 translesion error-prone D